MSIASPTGVSDSFTRRSFVLAEEPAVGYSPHLSDIHEYLALATVTGKES
jgi:hypothetical protein